MTIDVIKTENAVYFDIDGLRNVGLYPADVTTYSFFGKKKVVRYYPVSKILDKKHVMYCDSDGNYASNSLIERINNKMIIKHNYSI